VHGTAGVDSRGAFHATALNGAGIATLEIDMWAARGLDGGANGRPSTVAETLPDAYGALRFLCGHPRIDAARIGILGFSWGGIVSLLTATARYTAQYGGDAIRFAAHVANYPVCWTYSRLRAHALDDLTGAPVLIQAGELDTYDEPDTCAKLAASLGKDFVSVRTYANATHAWDRLEPAVTVSDPQSHLGMGGEVEFVPNPRVAVQSRDNALRFFQEAFRQLAGRES
jgi:dienelactone hydrolase